MHKIMTGLVLATLVFCGRAFALGLDIGPVHEHTKGSTEELKIVVDDIITDADGKTLAKIYAHRKDGNDKFKINIVSKDLDDTTRDLIKNTLKKGVSYKAHLEKLEDDWKLLKLRKDDSD